MMLKSQVAGSAALDAKWFWTGVVVDLAAAALDLMDIWYNLACVQAECWLVWVCGLVVDGWLCRLGALSGGLRRQESARWMICR